MKKLTSPAKLKLKLETVKALEGDKLVKVAGGNQPTSTFHSLEIC